MKESLGCAVLNTLVVSYLVVSALSSWAAAPSPGGPAGISGPLLTPREREGFLHSQMGACHWQQTCSFSMLCTTQDRAKKGVESFHPLTPEFISQIPHLTSTGNPNRRLRLVLALLLLFCQVFKSPNWASFRFHCKSIFLLSRYDIAMLLWYWESGSFSLVPLCLSNSPAHNSTPVCQSDTRPCKECFGHKEIA